MASAPHEFLADTDPRNGNDRFAVSDFTEEQIGDDFIMTFPSLPMRFYRIESSLTIAPPWADVDLGWLQGSATGSTTANLGNPPEDARLYRVAVKRPLTP